MDRSLSSNPARSRRLRAAGGVAGGVALIAALAAVDADWGPGRVVSTAVVLGPFLTALLAPPRVTAAVGALAIAVAIASGGWNEDFGDDAYWLRLAVVVIGAGLAVVASEGRVRAAESRERFALLAALAELGDGTETLDGTVERLCDLIVPAFADIVLVDVMRNGEPRRVGVRVSGPDAEATEAWLRERPPASPDEGLASRHVVASGRAHLIERVDEATMRRFASDDDDLERLLALGTRSSLTVPLRARGRILGALGLSVTAASGRRYSRHDAAFAEVAAGRAALALDNAGLFAELETTEAQLAAALGSLTDAVTVQTPQGRLLYANDAAAHSMGYPSARELLATPPSEVTARYDVFTEDGAPLDLDRLPGRQVLAGNEAEPLVVRAVDRSSREERWNVIKATAVRDRAGRPVLAVNVIEDITDAKRSEFAQRLLARAGEVLASSLDYEQTLQQVAELAVPELADWCGVSLPDRDGFMRQVAVAHVDAEKVRFARELAAGYPTRVDDPGGVGEVLREGVSLRFDEISDDLLRERARDPHHYELIKSVGMRAGMIVPLRVPGRVIGALTLVSAESGRAFTDADLRTAEELARRAANAVENARLYTERSTIAATLQAGLLPAPLPEMPGWKGVTLYRPAGEENWVGGDFFDAFPIGDGWMVVVGDVAGRGAPAAALTALARHTIRAVAQVVDDPLEAVERLNGELYERGGGALCTVACALLRETPTGSEATILCAGHPQPLLVRDGVPEPVGEFGPLVGALEWAAWSPVTVPVAPGDTLVIYTDGVIDSVGREERFGEERLRATLAGADGAHDAVRRIERALDGFQHGEQADDTAVVAICRVARPAAAPAEPALDARGRSA